MIRKQLEAALGGKVDDHKDFIRSQARSFLGLLAVESCLACGQRSLCCASSTAEMRRGEPVLPQVLAFIQGKAPLTAGATPEEQPAKVKGRVIIVGAGPAGLAAAMHLKVLWLQRGPCTN